MANDDVPAGWYPDPDDNGASQRYWDGNDWTERSRPTSRPRPAPQQPVAAERQPTIPQPGPQPQQQAPAPGPARKRPWIARHKFLTGVGVLIALVVVISASGSGGGGGTTTPAAPDTAGGSTPSSAAPSSKKAAVPAGTVLLTLTGTGTKSTQKFTTGTSDWDLAWTYDCSNFGQQGNFAVLPTTTDIAAFVTPVNQLGAKGASTEHYHSGGTFYLDINSECAWSVKATTA